MGYGGGTRREKRIFDCPEHRGINARRSVGLVVDGSRQSPDRGRAHAGPCWGHKASPRWQRRHCPSAQGERDHRSEQQPTITRRMGPLRVRRSRAPRRTGEIRRPLPRSFGHRCATRHAWSSPRDIPLSSHPFGILLPGGPSRAPCASRAQVRSRLLCPGPAARRSCACYRAPMLGEPPRASRALVVVSPARWASMPSPDWNRAIPLDRQWIVKGSTTEGSCVGNALCMALSSSQRCP